ncbi:MAG: hypothetical protein ACP5XB_29465, partial [Isosphaeraceae bacterium]
MSTIDEAVEKILGAELPVLFLDTCVLLDIIRAPLRPAQLRGCLQAALELRHLAGVPPIRCLLVVASFVPGEWLTHAEAEVQNLRAHLNDFDEEASLLHGFCNLVGITPSFPKPEYGVLSLAEKLHDVSRQLLDGSLSLEPDHACIIRAYGRATTYSPPSRKGGEVKDSTIVEECLEVSRRLEAADFLPKKVF